MCVRVICSIVGENFSYYTQQSFNTHKHTHTQSDTYTGAAVETDEKQFFCMKAVRARLYEYVTCAVLCMCVAYTRIRERQTAVLCRIVQRTAVSVGGE